MLNTDFLNDVAVYLVVSPLAALLVAGIAIVGWGLRHRPAPVAFRRQQPTSARKIAE